MLTCKSCVNYTIGGCLKDYAEWPFQIIAKCDEGKYEPGSDESEDEVEHYE